MGSCMFGSNMFDTQKIMFGTNRQLFLMHCTEHKFRAEDKKRRACRVPNVHLMPKFNVAEVRILSVHYERLLCKSWGILSFNGHLTDVLCSKSIPSFHYFFQTHWLAVNCKLFDSANRWMPILSFPTFVVVYIIYRYFTSEILLYNDPE